MPSLMWPDAPSWSWGRRIYRGFFFSVLVGLVSAGIAIMPALFVQSIFIGNAQRCEERERMELAATGNVRTVCAQMVSTTPRWLPPTIIIGSGGMGLVGGMAYGWFSATGRLDTRSTRERSWLPF